VHVATVSDLATLAVQLEANLADPKTFVIRGVLRAGVPTQNVLRRIHGSGACFEASARHWLCIDLDTLDLPAELLDFNARADDVVKHAISQLPAEFHDVDCWWQFSSSMGMKPGIRLHLWYWLDRPVSDQEAKAWLSDSPVDTSLYNPVQPHYVANPIFRDGIADPVTKRSGLLRHGLQLEAIAVPTDLAERMTRVTPTRTRSGGTGSRSIGSRDIVRDAAGTVVDGREWWLYLLSIEACRNLLKGLTGTLPSIAEIADDAWHKFVATTDLADGKWIYSDAYEKASYRSAELQDGWRPSTDFSRYDLVPNVPPFYQTDPVDLAAGTGKLDSALDTFFASVTKGQQKRLCLRVTMGMGKTRQTAQQLIKLLKAKPSINVDVYVPRHDLVRELAAALTIASDGSVPIIPIRGRGQHDDDGVAMCARYDVVQQLEQKGIAVRPNACFRSNDDKCPSYDGCPYWEQFRPQSTGAIRILPHAYLGLVRNSALPDPDLVVVDESALPSLITKSALSLQQIATHLMDEAQPDAGKRWIEQIRKGTPILDAARSAGITHDWLRDQKFDRAQGLLAPSNANQSMLASVTKVDLGYARSLTALCAVLAEELEGFPGRADASRLRYSQHFDSILINTVSVPTIPANASLLLLDATADPTIADSIWGALEHVRIDVKQNAHVIQVSDRSGSNHFWSDATHADELMAVATAREARGYKVLIVGNKTLADTLRDREPSTNIQIAHFNALRGTNEYEDCDLIIVAGRNQPPADEVDAMARALFWRDALPLQHDAAALPDALPGVDLPFALRGYTTTDTTDACGMYVRAFTDGRIEAAHAQIREAETIQAIARLRLVRALKPKTVMLLSNLPVDIPVDQVCAWNELMPNALDRLFEKDGYIPVGATGLYLLNPGAFKSEGAAKKALQRAGVLAPYQDKLHHLGRLNVSYRLIKDGEPHGRTQEMIFALQSLDQQFASITHDQIVDTLTTALANADASFQGVHVVSVQFAQEIGT
jgi:hypothetical protein